MIFYRDTHTRLIQENKILTHFPFNSEHSLVKDASFWTNNYPLILNIQDFPPDKTKSILRKYSKK